MIAGNRQGYICLYLPIIYLCVLYKKFYRKVLSEAKSFPSSNSVTAIWMWWWVIIAQICSEASQHLF